MIEAAQGKIVRVAAGPALELVYGAENDHLPWAAERIGGVSRWADGTISIGVERSGELCATALFNNFTSGSCQAHIATDGSRRWATRGILAAFFAYPFIQCGLRRLTLPIAASNRASLILAIKLGFDFEGRLTAGRAHDEDEIILGMLAERCPWIG